MLPSTPKYTTYFFFYQITTQHNLNPFPNSAFIRQVTCPCTPNQWLWLSGEAAGCATRAIRSAQSSHQWKRLPFLHWVKAAAPGALCSATVVRAVSVNEQRRSEQVPIYHFVTHFPTCEGLGQQVLTLHWCLSFPAHSCFFRDEDFLLMESSAGLWRGPETSITVQHISGKASHLPEPAPGQAHTSWSLLIHRGSNRKKGLGQPCHQPLTRS